MISNYNCGVCQCGCGKTTTKIKWSDKSRGLIKGQHRRFIRGHANKVIPYPRKRHNNDGRLLIYLPDHPRAMANGYVFNHILIAERAMGKYISKKIEVHHVNNDKTNDSPNNLVVCNDHSYHTLLHQRKRAFDACSNANHEKCSICGKYDEPANLIKQKKNKISSKLSQQTQKNAIFGWSEKMVN